VKRRLKTDEISASGSQRVTKGNLIVGADLNKKDVRKETRKAAKP
jgi:hypothetical protein